MLHELEKYLLDGFHKVHGWVAEPIWELLAIIDHKQRELGVSGGIAEIGVHHGRFFFGLQALKSDERSAVAIDVFDDQQFNVDKSGKGVKEVFLQNAAKYSVRPEAIQAIQADSLLVRQADIASIRESNGRFSMFSVDGGHTAVHVFHDFGIAEELTTPGGVIVVDDYNNPWWPGVQEGLARAFLLGNPVFVPLACGMNKLVLVDIGHHEIFLDALSHYFSDYPGARVKENPRYGWRSLSLALPDSRPHFSHLRGPQIAAANVA